MDDNKLKRRIGSAVFFVMLLLLTSSAYAPPIFVSVSGKIQATVDYINYSDAVDKAPQLISINVENVGSAGCRVKVRADFYKESVLFRTSWSEIKAIEPGDHFLFHNYWMPEKEGNISARIAIYQCNEIFHVGTFYFNVLNNSIERTDNIIVTDTRNDRDEINITILSNKTLENVVVIAENHPLGWIVEPARIGRIDAGEEKTVTVRYDASTWHEQKINFDIVAEDGTEYFKHEVQLKEEEPTKESTDTKSMIIAALLIIILVLLAVIFRMRSGMKKEEGKKPVNS